MCNRIWLVGMMVLPLWGSWPSVDEVLARELQNRWKRFAATIFSNKHKRSAPGVPAETIPGYRTLYAVHMYTASARAQKPHSATYVCSSPREVPMLYDALFKQRPNLKFRYKLDWYYGYATHVQVDRAGHVVSWNFDEGAPTQVAERVPVPAPVPAMSSGSVEAVGYRPEEQPLEDLFPELAH